MNRTLVNAGSALMLVMLSLVSTIAAADGVAGNLMDKLFGSSSILRLETNAPEAMVYIDGELTTMLDSNGASEFEVSQGAHSIRIEGKTPDGQREYEAVKEIFIGSKGRLVIKIDVKSKSAHNLSGSESASSGLPDDGAEWTNNHKETLILEVNSRVKWLNSSLEKAMPAAVALQGHAELSKVMFYVQSCDDKFGLKNSKEYEKANEIYEMGLGKGNWTSDLEKYFEKRVQKLRSLNELLSKAQYNVAPSKFKEISRLYLTGPETRGSYIDDWYLSFTVPYLEVIDESDLDPEKSLPELNSLVEKYASVKPYFRLSASNIACLDMASEDEFMIDVLNMVMAGTNRALKARETVQRQ